MYARVLSFTRESFTRANYGPMARRALRWAVTAISLLIPANLLWLAFVRRFGTLGYDEQYFVWTGWSVLKGSVPYKEFVEFKPPVLFLTHALALKLCGYEGMRFRWFFLVFVVASLMAVQLSLLSRRINPAFALALVVGAAYLISDGRYHDSSFDDAESVGYGYYMFAVAALLARTAYRNVTDALGGACLALCVFTKEPFLAPALGTWVTSFVAIDGIGDLRKTLPRYAKFTALGAGVVLAGLCLYMVPTGAMTAYFKLVYSYRSLYRDPQKSYCVLLGRFHPTGSLLRDLPKQWDVIHDSFFNPSTLGFLAPAFAASVVFLARRSPLALVLGMLTIAGGLYAVTASNCYWSHYYIMGQTGLCFFLFLGADASAADLRRSSRTMRLWACAVMLATVGLPAYERYKEDSGAKLNPPPDSASEPIPGVVEFVRTHSNPTEYIFTTGGPGLYAMADRLNATRESGILDEILESLPGTTDREKVAPLRQELLAAKPRVIVMDPEHGDRKRRFTAALLDPFIAEFGYQKVGPYYYVRP